MQGDFSIGDWRVQPQINLIHKGQVSFHIEPKVMQVLVLLASRPGELVSKDRLLQTVWSGVFVGDDVLTRAISEIRRVLTDDARSPRIIQTIPKTGYRLIAPVKFESPAVEVPGVAISAEPAPVLAEQPAVSGAVKMEPLPPAIAPVPIRSRRHLAMFLSIALALVCLIALAAWHFWPGSGQQNWIPHYRTVPFTSYPGSEGQAAFSPDGNQIAFVWNGSKSANKQIYVKILGTATPLRLTSDDADDVDPAWSPDGRFIAFIQRSNGQNAIYIVPAIGGPERRIHLLSDSTSWEYAGVAWSADGKNLIFPDRLSQQEPSSLFAISLDTLEIRRMTSPPSSWDGDWMPTISPDGRMIAFLRGPESAVRDVYLMNSGGGQPKRLTTDGRLVLGLAWTADSRNIVISSNRDGSFSLWQVPASGGPLTHLTAGGDNAYSPAISRRGNLLAYTHGTGKWDIVRLDLKAATARDDAGQILSSNEQDSSPQFSPDGTRLAFQSWRSGTQEVWTCAADGSDPVQLTSFGGALTGSPRWSPDGRQIAFDSRPDGRAHLFVISPDGGTPRALTNGDYNDIVPSWSTDGKWIYFGSNRSGNWQIWKIPAASGTARQVTRQGGMIAQTSSDGKWVYYTKNARPGLWRISTEGGAEEQVLQDPPNGFQGYWTLTPQGIYYLDTAKSPGEIRFAAFSSLDRSSLVHRLVAEPTPLAGLSISPDRRWMAYATTAEASSNITLVESLH